MTEDNPSGIRHEDTQGTVTTVPGVADLSDPSHDCVGHSVTVDSNGRMVSVREMRGTRA